MKGSRRDFIRRALFGGVIGQNADWAAIPRTARQLAHDCSKEAVKRMHLLGYKEARSGMLLATTNVTQLAGAEIANEIADARNYDEVCETIGAALGAKFIAVAFMAAGQTYLNRRSKGIIAFLLSLMSDKAKKKAFQSGYEAVYDRSYHHTGETLYYSAEALRRRLYDEQFLGEL